MWLVAVNVVGRVVILNPEQNGLPFAGLQQAVSKVGPMFTGASDTLDHAEFLARLAWARWITSDAGAAVLLRSSDPQSLADSVRIATSGIASEQDGKTTL